MSEWINDVKTKQSMNAWMIKWTNYWTIIWYITNQRKGFFKCVKTEKTFQRTNKSTNKTNKIFLCRIRFQRLFSTNKNACFVGLKTISSSSRWLLLK